MSQLHACAPVTIARNPRAKQLRAFDVDGAAVRGCPGAAAAQDKLVAQQLGPAPPPHASPGMLLQYNTMFSERRRSLVLDNACGLVENSAALLVKVRQAGAVLCCGGAVVLVACLGRA